MLGSTMRLACDSRSSVRVGGSAPSHRSRSGSPWASISARTASPWPSSGPTSTNDASTPSARSVRAVRTKASGRLRSCSRARNRTSVRSGRGAGSATSGTPFPSSRSNDSSAPIASSPDRSAGVRCRIAPAPSSTRRVRRASSGPASRWSDSTTMPCGWTTYGTPRRRSDAAAGSVTRSRARCTWATSRPSAWARIHDCRPGALSPLNPPGATRRAAKVSSGAPPSSVGASPAA